MKCLNVQVFVCNPFQEQCFIVWIESPGTCLVIDPGMSNETEWKRVQDFLVTHKLTPERILLTHNHVDHVMGTSYLTSAYPGLRIYGSEEDQNHLPSVGAQNAAFGVDCPLHWVPITNNLKEGEEFPFPAQSDSPQTVRVIDCPGHSHHGLCYYFADAKVLFSGDVLFYCSIGRADFGPAMGGNARLLIEGITQKLLTLPSDVKVYPGHGPATTIGNESNYNPYL